MATYTAHHTEQSRYHHTYTALLGSVNELKLRYANYAESTGRPWEKSLGSLLMDEPKTNELGTASVGWSKVFASYKVFHFLYDILLRVLYVVPKIYIRKI